MIIVEFQAPAMSGDQVGAFLKAIAATGVHLSAASLDPTGRGRIDIASEDFDKQEVRTLREWLERQPNVGDVRISLGGASA